MNENILNSNNFNDEINNTERLVIVDFYAEWCGPCKMLEPIIHEIAEKYANRIKVFKANVDENKDLTTKYNIASIPTLLFFKNGKLIKYSTGFVSKPELEEILNEL